MRTEPQQTKDRRLPLGTDWRRPAGERWNASHYAGLPIHADSPEVHERAVELLEKHAGKNARVLDLGAGAGALSRRLVDRGFQGVEAAELRVDCFAVPGVLVHPLDLNEPWAGKLHGAFDALVALEIIEHLENPWQFASQCALALKPGGIAVVSTPNIESARSRIEFLLKAEFRFFTKEHYERIGHITSLTANQLKWLFARSRMDFVERSYSRHKGMPRPGSLRRTLRTLLYALSYPFMAGDRKGEVSLMVFRRTT